MKQLTVILMMLAVCVFAASNVGTVTTTGNDNTANIDQSGSGNDALIDQTANSSSAEQTQNGDDNNASILQDGKWPDGPVVDNHATQTQIGSDNNADIQQVTDSGHGGSTATQEQNGNDQYAKAWQFSWNSTVLQQQTGASQNWAEAYQKGNYNNIQQVQNGIGNVAAVDEQAGWGGAASSNSIIQQQTGNWNHTLAAQYGGGNNAITIQQGGHDNWAGYGLSGGGQFGVYQSGAGNIANVTQNLNVNKSELDQIGNDNIANITQNGGTGLFGDYGDYVNKADVNQVGDSNNATVTQTYP